jgi:CO dehydrogenase/acetyl-CoA synthase beta subunit
MGMFEEVLRDVRQFVKAFPDERKRDFLCRDIPHRWPSGGDGNLVLAADTGIELGSPRVESVSFALWSGSDHAIRDGGITLIGPDLGEAGSRDLAYGKVVLVAGGGFDGKNDYDRYRELERARYDVDLEGYMIRAASLYQKEWIRISREALRKGLSFRILGEALIGRLRRIEYVRKAEVLFVTSSAEDVRKLKAIAGKAALLVGAMSKIFEETQMDCDACEYRPVCDEVSALKKMRESLGKERKKR